MIDVRIRETEEARHIMDAKVRDVMTPGPIGVDYDQSIGEAALAMRDWGVGAILVVSNGSLYGLDRKSTRLNSSHLKLSRMPSSA